MSGGPSPDRKPGARLLDLLEWRHAEEPLELPAELGRTLVADGSRRRARVVAVEGHERPGPVESDALDVLKRGTGRHELEVVVEDRHAHPRPPRELLDVERLRVLRVDVPQDPGDAREVI